MPPKADPFRQRRLLDLAATDRAVAMAQHRRRTLPELAVIAEGTEQLAGLRGAVLMAETEVSDLDRAAKKLDAEIDQVRGRADRDAQRLASGSGPAKDLESLQHEITSLARRQGVLEDEALELMERRETADATLAGARSAQDDVAARVAAAQTSRDDHFADLDAELGILVGRRAEQSEPLPADLLALYERIRGTGKVAAAELVGSQCGACRVELDRVAFSAARSAPVDDVVRCENCGAILIRH